MKKRLEGKKVLITAAGQGIGKATAIAFHNEGATVHATDINDKTLKIKWGIKKPILSKTFRSWMKRILLWEIVCLSIH